MKPPWPERCAFSDNGLRFASFGQRSFLAIDIAERKAVGYCADGLLADQAGFASPFLDTLVVMTASALRLTPLTAACVTMGKEALVVLGKPNNGKTTSSYLATRLGLEFYSDGTMFLDLDDGRLQAWGDFSPAVFRTDATTFLPELQGVGRPFHYRDLTFLYVEEATSIRSNGYPVIPVACIFLEKGVAGTPRLSPLNQIRFFQLLEESIPLKGDERFETRRAAVLSALVHVPAYSSDLRA